MPARGSSEHTACGEPWNPGDQKQRADECRRVRPDPFDGLNTRRAGDQAALIEADAEGGGEQTNPHRQDGDDCVLHDIDIELLGDGKQQRAEQDHRRQAFQHAAENDEQNDRGEHEAGSSPRQAGHDRG